MSSAKIIFILMLAASLACNKAPDQQSNVQASAAKRYHLKGKVVSIDRPSRMAMIDSEAIPGFMDAMTMPYQVKPETELDKLKPGDAITADVVVQGDNGWLENIVVTEHAPKSK
jgi:protein SCO1/2